MSSREVVFDPLAEETEESEGLGRCEGAEEDEDPAGAHEFDEDMKMGRDCGRKHAALIMSKTTGW